MQPVTGFQYFLLLRYTWWGYLTYAALWWRAATVESVSPEDTGNFYIDEQIVLVSGGLTFYGHRHENLSPPCYCNYSAFMRPQSANQHQAAMVRSLMEYFSQHKTLQFTRQNFWSDGHVPMLSAAAWQTTNFCGRHPLDAGMRTSDNSDSCTKRDILWN